MTVKKDLKVYRDRWKAVETVQAEERRAASMELRWQQLNAAYNIAKGLGILQSDPSELQVYERWATLKAKANNQLPKA